MNKNIFISCIFIFMLSGCDQLDTKPRQSLVVPSTLKDFQGLLDNYDVMNNFLPTLGEIAADDYYVTLATWQAQSTLYVRNAYIWANNVFEGATFVSDWNSTYSKVFYANVVLDGLKDFSIEKNQAEYNDIKGQALFHRAHAFYVLSQIFTKHYDESSAASDLGLPLRLSSDINLPSTRSTLQETYRQIITDLEEALPLLSQSEHSNKSRPSKRAANALLARTFLIMQDYIKALQAADEALAINSTLLDYNTVSPNADYPFSPFNEEIIFHASYSNVILRPDRALVDTFLYKSYEDSDLRKTLFFRRNANGTQAFRGSYRGAVAPSFAGIATDELYLIRAESQARTGNVEAAMATLNDLLITRYDTEQFLPVTADNESDALGIILMERRKELLFRGLRWSDLRRLNTDPRFAVTLTRKLNDDTYKLPAGDRRYVFAIPDYVIEMSGIPQNP